MNFIKCTHCGNKVMTHDTRLDDLEHYRQELLVKKENLQKKCGDGKSKVAMKIKAINIELDEVKKQLGVARRIVSKANSLDEISTRADKALIEALKEYVTKEQFMMAAEKSNKIRESAKIERDNELKKVYGIVNDVKEKRFNRNSEGYVDITATTAIKNLTEGVK